MSIQEVTIPHWQNVKLSFKHNKYPNPKDPAAPRCYFVGLFVGSRGSGKSFMMVKLLKQYENYGIYDTELKHDVGQRIILFSPTSDANPVFTSLKHLSEHDIIHNYSDTKLINAVEDVKREKENTLTYQEDMKIYKRFLNLKHIEELTPHELHKLEMNNYEPPEPPKYPFGCVTFFVLDDLVGSTAFKSVGKSALTNLVLKNRHLGINMLIATQNLKAIPKGIRTNTSLFVIFKFASKRIITEDLYEEVSNCLTLPKFEELLDHATRDEHDCLVIDFSQPKEDRFKQNFNRILRIS